MPVHRQQTRQETKGGCKPTYIDQTFGESVRIVRKQKNLSVKALALRAGLPLERVRRIDAGEVAAYLNEAKAISDALGVTVDALMRGAVSRRGTGVFRNAIKTIPTDIKGDKK